MNMAYCKHCHTELEMGALFCPECGCREVEEPEPSNPDSSILEPQKETKLLGQAEGAFACRMQGTESLSQLYVRKHKSTGEECRGTDSQLSWLEIRMA